MITNPFYCGVLKVKGDLYKGKHEKIISEETFDKCQSLLKRSNRGENISRRRTNVDFPLRNFAICSVCERPLTAAFSTGHRGGKYPYYRCYNKYCSAKKSINQQSVENDFLELLKQITPKREYLDIFKPIVIDVWNKNYNDLNKRRNDIMKKIEKLNKEKEKLIDMKKKELLPDEDFKEAFEEIKEKIRKEIILSETRIEQFNPTEAINYVFNFITNIPEFWKKADCQQKIRLQSLIFTEKPIYTYPKFGTPKICLILQQKTPIANDRHLMVALRGVEPRLPD
ncbi:recombinase family protein [Patescibacteria group bacterium]|nr:recombinase family protein [Patescibacteria group bacterium]